ncbi:hypothetical protein SLS63_009884 [Diaporthe eres]|uniref:Clr5 domain-containing protein n=1 Tax=Diaporthe eres TaxID=83184 RepID=A0ABR1NYJ6_DIAER
MDEDRTLHDVMEIMKRDLGFDATKNIKLRHGEDESVIQLLHNTAQNSTQTGAPRRDIRLRNGQLVSKDRLVTYLRRRGEGKTGVNEALTLRTVKSPDTIYVCEGVLFHVRTYIRGPWVESVTTAERLDLLRQECADNEEWNALARGVRCALEQQKLNDALVLMRRAPVVLANLIERRPANLLQVLFMSLAYFTSGGLLERPQAEQLLVVVRCLIKYAAEFAVNEQGLPSSHPIHQMLYMLANADQQDISQLTKKAWLINCQSWDGVMDRPRSTCAVAAWISYGEFNGFDAMPSNLGNILELMVIKYAAIYGEYHRRTIHILLIYSTYLTYRDRANGRNPYFNEEINKLFEDILRRGPQGALKVDALSWLARSCRARGERGYAEAYMRELIDDLLQDAALRDSSARKHMDDLEMWFIEWGETEKAAEVARRREEELSAGVTAKFECNTGN